MTFTKVIVECQIEYRNCIIGDKCEHYVATEDHEEAILYITSLLTMAGWKINSIKASTCYMHYVN